MDITLIEKNYSWDCLNLEEFLTYNIPTEWVEFFEKEEVQTEIAKISAFLERNNHITIYPPINQVFRAFYITSINDLKVVLIGQDPYHNSNAVGFCFSVRPGNKVNPSLKNIYKELIMEDYKPHMNGDLLHWAKQGVFLYNMGLTVEKGCADSHTGEWYRFSELLIEYIVENTQDICWLLMGKRAQEIIPIIKKNKSHTVFKTSHPSPFSAMRGFGDSPAFIGSNVFREINNKLEEKIEW